MGTTTLETLLKKQSELQTRIKLLEAKQTSRKRKEDTRRKILAGAYVLDKYEKLGTKQVLLGELDKFLFKKRDRELFGLKPCLDEKNVNQINAK